MHLYKYAEVVVASAAKDLDKSFHYAIGAELAGKISIGQRVLVPFGKTRQLEGYVVGFSDEIDFDVSKIKEIEDVLEDFVIFSTNTLSLARWMSAKYSTPLAVCLKTIMPAGIAMKNDYVAQICDGIAITAKGKSGQILQYLSQNGATNQREIIENFGKTAQTALRGLEDKGFVKISHIYDVKDYSARINFATLNDALDRFDDISAGVLKKGDKQAKVLEMLMGVKTLPVSDIQLRLGISPSPIKSLEQKGLITIEKVVQRRIVPSHLPIVDSEVVLTSEQEAAVNKLYSAIDAENSLPILIHGVTGSGKTEIYMRAINKVLAKDKQAIMLVPEISLTPQAVAAFTARFGSAVTFTHSRLSLGERYDQWKRAKDGEVQVIIGPRSAIFTPFDNLGIIIIDEEHENTYKSETAPKYDTIDVAKKMAELTGALLVLGTATPAISTYHQVRKGHIGLITLQHRINKRFAKMEIADMRDELANGNKTMFSAALHAAITQNLAQNQQTILFLNRRGHSTFVSCRTCGHVLACESCSVNYTYHMYSQRLMCHYCAAAISMPKNCPTCGSIYIRYFGIGTQKVEEYLAEVFPSARVLRMDLDTTTTKDSHSRIIKAFGEGEADILVGTQMIAKGLNFPEVSLVGIVAADIALNSGDYRAAETAYQLITQVSGRAGRGLTSGRVVIQTYDPDHYSIKYAIENDYQTFYNHEIEIRRQMNYPPFTHIFMIVFIGKNEQNIIVAMHELANIMKQANRKGLCDILGPAPAVIPKIRQNYRWKILVKCVDEEILKQFVFYCLEKLKKAGKIEENNINIGLTLDPAYII